MDKIKACILTLGCRVNQNESDAIMQELSSYGVEICDIDTPCDIYIINTCTVTAESDRKSRQFIRRCTNIKKDSVVIVTGCFSQLNPDEVLNFDGVDYVCGNNGKSSIAKKALSLLKEKRQKEMFMPDIFSGVYDHMSVSVPLTRTRAFIKIEDGCNSSCAYCVIPKARGSVRSDTKENILSQVKSAVAGGCKEVVLTGIETSAYGLDFKNGYDLASLLCDVNKVDGLERIRLGSLDPASINKSFVDKVCVLEKLMPHFHLSMQSGCTKTLNDMRRKYNIEMAKNNINYLRQMIPGCMLSADVITGFPGETDENFSETIEFFRETKFLRLHIFPYSRRKDTEAYSMKNQIAEEIKKERLKTLSGIQKEIKKELQDGFCKNNDSVCVLFEDSAGDIYRGHAPNFMEVKAKSASDIHGKILRVTNLKNDGEFIYGDIIND